MASVRNRSRERWASGGTHIWFDDVSTRSVRIQHELMTDYTGKKVDLYGRLPDSALDHSIRRIKQPVIMSGVNSSGNSTYSGFPASVTATYTLNNAPSSHSSKDKGNTQYLNELLSRTNPGRPEFSIPVAIKELAEVATLFEFGAKSFAGFAGGAYLNYRFGWKAFLRDIRTLANITKAVESRLKEIDSLLQSGGIRRSVELDQYSTTVPYTGWTVNSAYSTRVDLDGTDSYRTRVIGTVRWFPAPGAHQVLENRTPLETFNNVIRDIFDIGELDASTVWQLVPFSWLADYFLDVSSYLDASTGSALYTPDYINIVRRSTYTSRGRVSRKPDWVRVSGHHQVTYRTVRTPLTGANVALPRGLNILTMSQAKVVIALLAKFRDMRR